jgi:hypothetical protein
MNTPPVKARRDICVGCGHLVQSHGRWFCFVIGRELPAGANILTCTARKESSKCLLTN